MLRSDDDEALTRKEQHWVDRHKQIHRGELGDDEEHRSLLLRGVALFSEAVVAEQFRRAQ